MDRCFQPAVRNSRSMIPQSPLDAGGGIAEFSKDHIPGDNAAAPAVIGDPVFLPCTPAGVMEMLKEYDIPVAGKHCVVLGRSNIVGKPMGALLLQQSGTVTTCHSRTPDLASMTRQADILVSAVGRVGLVTADMVKEGAVVIDVAMNRNAEGKLCGDVDYASVEPKASYITPVPGGVGPMTIAMLMKNAVSAAKIQNGLSVN